ncbi:pyridoxal kinase [Saprolegnia parasitica CBS 223.65]|uniref:pyridoxal kinase n=1 Tax=Saprolegnia parasitica (strain CBS 223.65) TaxID=695850 RepID=A0A067CRL9_SAPPC|nr:pyridoxal kinase [Saprolegnia parasitica CBS 223.65]KDO33344.1 pyridoxal kinase [Saprolegnia parasitica CBS 223.65]|eukprot:XP_012196092.1 pyridoxal kinase [Saprolegnia parasitica CBS 223.65]
MTDARVLSIQSHVVHGYVGNRSAVFPLQLLGVEVDVLNTVHLSNHTGYKKFRGQRMDAAQLEEVVLGLEENDLLNYSHLLTGYIGSPGLAHAIVNTLTKLRAKNKDTLYVCDPVMGDENKLYVPRELVDIYRDQIIPLADIVTPNQFECELLTGLPMTCDADVIQACRHLHGMGPKIVVISSFLTSDDAETLFIYASEKISGTDFQQFKMEIPRLQEYYSGTGDLFAALLLGWLSKPDVGLKAAVENIVASIQAVLKRTSAAQSANRELKLIQSRHDLEFPTVTIHATAF